MKDKIDKNLAKIEKTNKDVRTVLEQDRNKSKETELLDENPETIKCDKCEFNTVKAEELRKHIVSDHATNVFQGLELQTPELEQLTQDAEKVEIVEIITEKFNCDKCEDTFSSKKDIERHTELHYFADNLSLNYHVCRVCDKQVETKDQKLQCTKCIHIFHKKCTDKKDMKKNWKTRLWSCHICTTPAEDLATITAVDTLNPNAEAFAPSCFKQPNLSGKYRKSKVNETNREVEFLKATVDTLKATIAKN